ncbi:MAG TPA: hypothetical protein VM434_12955 [Beijerinckiaceae bacterium]|nr:hypothetical protein [Beijerinckiaceae bacterium]
MRNSDAAARLRSYVERVVHLLGERDQLSEDVLPGLADLPYLFDRPGAAR